MSHIYMCPFITLYFLSGLNVFVVVVVVLIDLISGILMRNLVVKKKKGTKLWCHGTSREACRERKDGRKEELLPKFLIFSIQRCTIK